MCGGPGGKKLGGGRSSPPRAAPRKKKGKKNDRLFKKVMDERFNFWLSEVKRTAHVEIRM